MDQSTTLTTSLTLETGDLREAAEKLLVKTGHRQVSILATGKLGTGKSALINGLVGEEVATESDSIVSETTKVKAYTANLHGITVSIWDSPGITVGAEDEKENLKSIAEQVREIDLVLYCLKMDDLRIQKQDVLTINHFTEAFGPDFWMNAVFALTFANKVLPPRNYKDPEACKKFFEDRLYKWKEELSQTLIDAKVPECVVESVSFVPAGHYSDPSLPDGCNNWLSRFWSVCLDNMKERAQPALLNLNLDRMKPHQAINMEDYRLPLHKQPINYETVRRCVIPGVGAVAGGVVGGVAAGPVGVPVGGAIGGAAGIAFQFIREYFYGN